MFDIITKQEYWSWIEAEGGQTFGGSRTHSGLRSLAGKASQRLRAFYSPSPPYELKDVQDAFIMSRLKTIQGKRILEVGGGSPRVLKILAKENECWLVDKFEGVGRGPKDIPRIKPIKIVQGYMGEHLDVLPTRYFDIIFSISVVEHIPIERLEAFFRDCGRVLKPGGKMLHAIDTYTFDSPQERLNRPFQDRLAAYLQFANRPDLGIRLTEAPAIDAGLEFSCQYATLPDNVMHEWYLNRKDDKRLRGQVVSVKSEWEKLAEQETE